MGFHLIHGNDHLRSPRFDGTDSIKPALRMAASRALKSSFRAAMMILTVMLAFTEHERGIIIERTQSVRQTLCRNPDFHDGRPRKFTDEQIRLALDLLVSGRRYGQVWKMTEISKSTLLKAKY